MSEKFHSLPPGQIREGNRADDEAAVWVLVIEDQEAVREVCQQVIQSIGYRALVAESGAQALEIMERQHVDIVIADIKMPGMSGGDLLEEMKSRNPRVEVAIVTSNASVPAAVRAMKLGASDYIVKPFSTEEIRVMIERLAQTLNLKDENHYLRERLESRYHFAQMVGQSQQMQQVFKLIQKVSSSRSPVLILGESGTGKELAARAIHETGPWRDKPFVPIDCGALPPTLIESELFGYVKGAFTGAAQSRQGLLAAAGSGTVFLDEIGELPIELQSRLLRALQEHEIRPLGSNERIRFEARIIAATNLDLEAGIKNGKFRKDLFFRLNVVTIKMPSLRDRKEDIPALIRHFLERYDNNKPATQISDEALGRLMGYDWPGNIRELENCIQRAVSLGSGTFIQMEDLPSAMLYHLVRKSSSRLDMNTLQALERQAIRQALQTTAGIGCAPPNFSALAKPQFTVS